MSTDTVIGLVVGSVVTAVVAVALFARWITRAFQW